MPHRKGKTKTHINPLYHDAAPFKLPNGLSVFEALRIFVADYHRVDTRIITLKTILDETLGGKAPEDADWWEFIHYLNEEFDVNVDLEEGLEFNMENVAAYVEAELSKRRDERKR